LSEGFVNMVSLISFFGGEFSRGFSG